MGYIIMNDTGRVVMLYPLKCCAKCGCLSIGAQLMLTENSTNHLRVVNFWAKLTEIEWVRIGCLSTLSLKIMATVIFRGCRTAAPHHTAQIDIMAVFRIVDDKCCIMFHWVSSGCFHSPCHHHPLKWAVFIYQKDKFMKAPILHSKFQRHRAFSNYIHKRVLYAKNPGRFRNIKWEQMKHLRVSKIYEKYLCTKVILD